MTRLVNSPELPHMRFTITAVLFQVNKIKFDCIKQNLAPKCCVFICASFSIRFTDVH